MIRRGLLVAFVVVAAAFFTQPASADPTKAKNSVVVTIVCGSQQLQVSVNGNGTFSPGHLVNSTGVLVPTAINLTISFTPTGGTAQISTETGSKQNPGRNSFTCTIPAALNTFKSPQGTLTLSGTVTVFRAPPSG
jgi:hypothetical protein